MKTLASTQLTVGLVILIGHFISLSLIMIFWIAGGYTFDEIVNLFAVIAPMFAAYLSLIINFSFRTDFGKKSKRLSPLAKVFSLAFPTAFVLLMSLAISLKAFNVGLNTMDNLIKFIGIIEIAMGGFTATVVKNLFPAAGPISGSEAQPIH